MTRTTFPLVAPRLVRLGQLLFEIMHLPTKVTLLQQWSMNRTA